MRQDFYCVRVLVVDITSFNRGALLCVSDVTRLVLPYTGGNLFSALVVVSGMLIGSGKSRALTRTSLSHCYYMWFCLFLEYHVPQEAVQDVSECIG